MTKLSVLYFFYTETEWQLCPLTSLSLISCLVWSSRCCCGHVQAPVVSNRLLHQWLRCIHLWSGSMKKYMIPFQLCHQLHSNSDFFRNSANWEAYTGLEPLLGPTVRQTGELNYQEACTSLVFLEIATATIDWVWSLSCPFYRPFVVISLYWWLVYSNTVNRIKLKIDSYLVNRIILKIGKLSISIL